MVHCFARNEEIVGWLRSEVTQTGFRSSVAPLSPPWFKIVVSNQSRAEITIPAEAASSSFPVRINTQPNLVASPSDCQHPPTGESRAQAVTAHGETVSARESCGGIRTIPRAAAGQVRQLQCGPRSAGHKIAVEESRCSAANGRDVFLSSQDHQAPFQMRCGDHTDFRW